MSPHLTAATLLREVGLLPDGPLPWGRPVPARSAGVFVLELPAPLEWAPIELTRVGKWIERVPDLRLDGERPTSKALAARLAAFWLPSQAVLYIGATERSIGGRLAAIERTALGDRRPSSSGHWLHTLRVLPTLRVWWAATDAVEEYEDALAAAFAHAVEPAELAAQAAVGADAAVMPFANLRRPTGERRPHGLSGSLLPDPAVVPPPPTRIVVVPDGDAEGARGEPPTSRRRSGAAARSGGVPAPGSGADQAPGTKGAATGGGAANGRPGTTPDASALTADGAARLQAELTELIGVRRPEVIARIRAAKELGDLKENADYTAAREEQSFLEGRIQALEARLRDAVIADAPTGVAGDGADFGSRVTVEADGQAATYMLVGSAESDPAAGRLSVASPVGRALLGARPGSVVTIETPRGRVDYLVRSVD